MTTPVFIGLGSNRQSEENLQAAVHMLRERWPDIRFSHVYRTAALEVTEQDAFLNAVGRMKIDDSPKEIQMEMHRIEKRLGKAPPYRFGPRTIDMDILLYGDELSDDPSLTLPHPRMHLRRFVLEPLTELLSPTQRHPRLGRSWGDLLSQTLDQKCERVPSMML